MHGEGCRDDVRRVSALLASNLHVFAQQWAIVGVSDGDERLGFLRSTLVAQVGNAVFRHDGVNVVLCVVDVRAEWHDARDGSALLRRSASEGGEHGVASVVARTANSIHHSRTADFR